MVRIVHYWEPRHERGARHQLVRLCDGGYSCEGCGWDWKSRPQTSCPMLPRYPYGAWPLHLFTATQLERQKLHPIEPAGCYYMRKTPYIRYLYDIREAISWRKPTARQEEAIQKMQMGRIAAHTCIRCDYFDRSLGHAQGAYSGRKKVFDGYCYDCREEQETRGPRAQAAEWAHEYLQGDFVVLDSETTGLCLDHTNPDEIIELAIVSKQGNVLFNSLIQTQECRYEIATHIHGIRREELRDAPTFLQVWPQILEALRSASRVLVFNASFDYHLLEQTAKRYSLELPPDIKQKWRDRTPNGREWDCLMMKYSAFEAEYYFDWETKMYRGYAWQSLKSACARFAIPSPEAHRAQADALRALSVLGAMAAQHGRILQFPKRKDKKLTPELLAAIRAEYQQEQITEPIYALAGSMLVTANDREEEEGEFLF